MSTLWAAIGDHMDLQLVRGAIGKEFPLDKHERSQDIVVLFIGKVILMDIMTDFVV